MIAHIRNFYEYSLSPDCPFVPEWKRQGEDYYREQMETLHFGQDVFIPFLEQHTEQTPEDEKLLDEIMATEADWNRKAEDKTQPEETKNAEESAVSAEQETEPTERRFEVTMTSDAFPDPEDVFAIWDNNLLEYIEDNDMVGKFQETYPNIDIEVEKIKDDTEYWNAMKMRASANQLPDVMFNKPFTLSRFKDYLLDLSDLEAAKNNELASGYALDGKVLGVPMTAGYEYVYYWKDMFADAGVEVPDTWQELQDAATKLQESTARKILILWPLP